MAYNITSGYGFMSTAFNQVSYFGESWLLGLMAVGITLLIMTREFQKWKSLALPVTLAWWVGGLKPNMIFLFVVAIIGIIDTISVSTISDYFGATQKIVEARVKTTRKLKARTQNVMDRYENERTYEGQRAGIPFAAKLDVDKAIAQAAARDVISRKDKALATKLGWREKSSKDKMMDKLMEGKEKAMLQYGFDMQRYKDNDALARMEAANERAKLNYAQANTFTKGKLSTIHEAGRLKKRAEMVLDDTKLKKYQVPFKEYNDAKGTMRYSIIEELVQRLKRKPTEEEIKSAMQTTKTKLRIKGGDNY